MENKFYIIVPVYNAIYSGNNYIENCLSSILSQTYKNYEVVVIDDCSTDGTWETIQKYPFHKLRNENWTGEGSENMLKAVRHLPMKSTDILVIVDGDDWLAGDFVLDHLNEVYQRQHTWITYGQMCFLSNMNLTFCRRVIHTFNYRREGNWCTSHLKTYRRGLFDRIKDQDLRGPDGRYAITGDLAKMYPMLEMAGPKRSKFIERVLYIYNDCHPPGNFGMDRLVRDQNHIRALKPYNLLSIDTVL